jgi:hypothetical protein
MLAGLIRMAFLPGMLQRRSRVRKIWYESNREQDDSTSSSLAVRLLHAFILLLVIGWILQWGLIPWSLTPREELLGQIRILVGFSSIPMVSMDSLVGVPSRSFYSAGHADHYPMR